MASENETVEEIKYRIYSHWRGCENCSLEEMDGADLIAIADQFEAAHEREVAALKKELEEWKSNCNFNHSDRKKKQKQIAELRECLKEAIREKCPFTRMSCKHGEQCDYECGTERWRKALEGVNNEKND